jgi:hypothetical protein
MNFYIDKNGYFGGSKPSKLSIKQVCNHIEKAKDSYLSIYEEIKDKCVKAYFDIDFIVDLLDCEGERQQIFDRHINKLMTHYNVPRDEVICFDSCGIVKYGDKEVYKVSFHMIVDHVYEQGSDIKAVCDEFNTEDGIEFDISVYKDKGKTQKFRIPYTVKFGDKRVLRYIEPETEKVLSLAECLKDYDMEMIYELSLINTDDKPVKKAVKKTTKKTDSKKTDSKKTTKKPEFVFCEEEDDESDSEIECENGHVYSDAEDEDEDEKTETKTNAKTTTKKKTRGPSKKPIIPKQLISWSNDVYDEVKSALYSLVDRVDDRSKWRDVVFAIASIYVSIDKSKKEARTAIFNLIHRWSKKSKKYDKKVLNDLFKEAVKKSNNTTSDGTQYITKNSLFQWVKEDNPQKFKEITFERQQKLRNAHRQAVKDAIRKDGDMVCDDDNEEFEFECFRDYRKLIKLDRENDSGVPISLGKKWIKQCVCVIEQGGNNSMLITKNKRLNDDNVFEFYYETASLGSVQKILSKACKFQNPTFNPKKPESKTNIRFIGKKYTLAEFFEMMFQEDEVPNYNSIDFKPWFKNETKLYDTFNLFSGFPLMSAISDYESNNNTKIDSDAFLNSKMFAHIRDELTNKDESVFAYLNKWIGRMIQYPDKRSGINILMYSEQGGGKDLCGHFIAKLVGEQHSLTFGKISDFLQKHNTEQQGKLFIRLNEISDRGDAFKNHNVLKNKTDEKKHRIEPKGLPAYYVTNHANFMFFSNNKQALFIENSDRRYCLIEASNAKCNDRKYFAPIWEELDNMDILMSAFHYYSTLDVENFIQEPIPNTKYRDNQKLSNLNSVYRFITELLDKTFTFDRTDSHYPDTYKVVKDDDSKIKEIIIGSSALYALYRAWFNLNGESGMRRQSFKSKLEDANIECCRQMKINGKNGRVCIINLNDFQKFMRKHLRQPDYTIECLIDDNDDDDLECVDSDDENDDSTEVFSEL